MAAHDDQHIPAPKPERLKLALAALEKAVMPTAAKRYLADVLKAAANPNAERIDVVISTLPHGRRENVQATAAEIGVTAKAAVKRGRMALMGMSADEWDKLVEEAAQS